MDWKPKPIDYKKINEMYRPKKELTKWQKFKLGFAQFIGKGLCGRWEINFKIKF